MNVSHAYCGYKHFRPYWVDGVDPAVMRVESRDPRLKGDAMAVGMLQMLQGTTKGQYEQVNQKLFGQPTPATDQLPQGLIMHSAGPVENGWYIYDVWESREDFRRFMDGPLGDAVGEIFGDQPPPPGSEPQFFEIESLAVAPTS
jgi:hypothetical protein